MKYKIYGCICGQLFYCKDHCLRHINHHGSDLFFEAVTEIKPNEGIGFFYNPDIERDVTFDKIEEDFKIESIL